MSEIPDIDTNPTCPSCGTQDELGNGFDGKTCAHCKYNASHALDMELNQAKAEASYLFGAEADGFRYGVTLDVRYHNYPHDSETFGVGEALKLATQLINAVTEAVKKHNEEFSPIKFTATDGTNF